MQELFEALKVQELATALLSFLATYVTYVLLPMAKEAVSKYILERRVGIASTYLTALNDLVADAVGEVFQTYVRDLKETGKWTEDTQKIARQKALDQVREMMCEGMKDTVTTLRGDIDRYVGMLIESRLDSRKEAKLQ
ncbi:MAG: hypothetical protein FWE76_04055 [Symbiobacteriaceae bacterium]|nr:hypothetical protein [Symbiobacteriaceae bacterium]